MSNKRIEPGEGRRHVGVLLRIALQAFVDELFRRFSDAGFEDLRPAHSPVFQHLEPGGSRIGVLAERAQMTNQSMGYLVDELERRGYVERRSDPSDRRASLVVVTDRGRELIATARRLIEAIEHEWRQRVGVERMTALEDALEALHASLAADDAHGPSERAPLPASVPAREPLAGQMGTGDRAGDSGNS